MKYYLKDKNGIVHTESNEHKFKLALEFNHKKDKSENFYTTGPVYNGRFGYTKTGEQPITYSFGYWSMGVPDIHRKKYGTTDVEWFKCSNSNYITNKNIIIGTHDLIKNRDISNDIIIKYNTNNDKFASNCEMSTFGYDINNNLMSWYNLQTSNDCNMNNLITFAVDEAQHWTWGYDNNNQPQSDKFEHSVYNSKNKYFVEHKFQSKPTGNGSVGGNYDYFTIKKSDWSSYSKIRIRIKMMMNLFETSENPRTPENEWGTLGDVYSFQDISTHNKPFNIVARTTNNDSLNESDYDKDSLGYLMFFNGDDTRGDTFSSIDTTKENKVERKFNDDCKDYIVYEQLTPTYYYTHHHADSETTITITRDELINYINDPNPKINIIVREDEQLQIGDTVVNVVRDTDIKNLANIFKNATGDEDWFERAIDAQNFTFPYTFPYSSGFNTCYSFMVEGYYDIPINKLKDYLHIFAPIISGGGTRTNVNYFVYSDLEMSIEGVN